MHGPRSRALVSRVAFHTIAYKMQYTCEKCGASFACKQALGGHVARGQYTCTGATLPQNTRAQPPIQHHTTDNITTDNTIPSEVPHTRRQCNNNVIRFNINQLLQRPKRQDAQHVCVPVETVNNTSVDTNNTYNLHETQEAYDEYCSVVRGQYCDNFWRMFATVYRERAVVIDRVLKTCKDVFVLPKAMKNMFAVYMIYHIWVVIYGCSYMVDNIWVVIYGWSYMGQHIWVVIYGWSYMVGHIWLVIYDRSYMTHVHLFILTSQSSVRELRRKSLEIAGHFPSLVMHEIRIDVRKFRLPGKLEEVRFRFINPLWAWVAAANDMIDAGHKMNYQPQSMFHETTNESLYGASVVFGKKLSWAAARTPQGGKPALFGISFDGGESGVSNRSLYPICVSVLNFDGTEPLACGLVGYMPELDVPKVFKHKKKRFLLARGHVFQRCIGAILDEVEAVSRDGFSARLGSETIRLHPFLVAVRVDSKERKTYFGLKSDRCYCSYMTDHISLTIY